MIYRIYILDMFEKNEYYIFMNDIYIYIYIYITCYQAKHNYIDIL